MQKNEIREQLVELISEAQDCGCDVTDVVDMIYVENEVLADHLLAHGVTFQRWIPVSERLPEDCETVLVYAVGYMELGWYDTDNGEWRSDEYTWDADEVTHWLPLPQTPKEET